MAQIVRNICDLCSVDRMGKEEPATSIGLPIMVGARSIIVDLCGEHQNDLDLALESFFRAGRIESAPAPPAKKRGRPAKEQNAPSSRAHYQRNDAGEYACEWPDCGRIFETAQGLATHRNYAHGLPPATGRSTKPSEQTDGEHHCTSLGCGRSFETFAGLRMHMVRTHRIRVLADAPQSSPNGRAEPAPV